jgi:hypothetical protein
MENNIITDFQKSQAWIDKRIGKFTSSEIHKLFGAKTTADTPLAVTAKTYILDKFSELTTGFAKEITGRPLEWGTMQEPYAKQELVNRHQARMWESEFIQSPEMACYGGSPDGWIEIDGVKHTVEIKCPYNTTEHYKNIWLTGDPVTWKKDYPELYWQLQSNMYLQGYIKGLFVTYDPRIKIGNSGYYEAFIDRNEDDIALMLIQLNKAYIELQAIGFLFDINIDEMFGIERKLLRSDGQ